MYFIRFNLGILCLLFLVSCGNGKGNSKNYSEVTDQETQTLEKGSVNSIFSNSDQLGYLKFLDETVLRKGIYLSYHFQFKKLGREGEDLFLKKDLENPFIIDVFESNGDLILKNDKLNYSFEFRKISSIGWDLKRFRNESRLLNLSTIHYGMNKNQTAFSMMALDDLGALHLFSFTTGRKITRGQVSQRSSPYYIYNKALKWEKNKTHHLYVCEKDPVKRESVYKALKKAWRSWSYILKNRISVKILKASRNFPPLGDPLLNCLYIVNDYRHTHLQSNISLLGTALMNGSFRDSHFVDGDIVLWQNEFEKRNNGNMFSEKNMNLLVKTLTHELGHWLGLSHPPTHQNEPPSIMSDISHNKPTENDEERILELYSF